MRSFPFYKLSPGGNPTILVHDDVFRSDGPDAAALRSATARALMDPDHLGAEQVGFLDTSRTVPHLEMMGGEFCVNACRCAAFVFARLGLVPHRQDESTSGAYEGTLTTSGADAPVRVRVTPLAPENDFSRSSMAEAAIAVSLPADAPHRLVTEAAPGETVVRLPGITHLLLDTERHPIPHSPLDAATVKRAQYSLNDQDAAGVIWYTPSEDGKTCAILPVVHVAATRSAVAETACGSGSLAVALLLAQGNSSRFSLRQPSGQDISISIEDDGAAPLRAWVSGLVRLAAEGIAYSPT